MALANQSVPPLEGERWHSHCRFCRAPLTTTLVDLGTTPAANAYQTPTQMRLGETYYPLHAYVCDSCKLVQLEDFQTPGQLFSDYLYSPRIPRAGWNTPPLSPTWQLSASVSRPAHW